MTTTDDTTQQPDPAEGQQPDPAEQQPDDGGQEQQPPGNRDAAGEAAKYRRRAQEAEAARDALQARVDAADAAEVERIAGEHLFAAGDLLLVTSLADLRGSDGAVDPKKVEAACKKAIEQRPNWRKPLSSHYDFEDYEQDDGTVVRVKRRYRADTSGSESESRAGVRKFFSRPA